MNKLLIILGIVIVGIVVSIPLLITNDTPPESVPVYDTGFTYYGIEIIQDNLKEQNIFVSAPTAITDHTINER